MLEYFIRHGSPYTDSLAVHDSTINKLWEENRIAIHFSGGGKEDSTSLNPNDYKLHREIYAIERFRELNDFGGYMMAYYRTKPDHVKIGIIKPKSFKIRKSPYSTIDGRIARLKTLKFDTDIEPQGIGEIEELWSKRPRQRTIVRWRSAKGELKRLIESHARH